MILVFGIRVRLFLGNTYERSKWGWIMVLSGVIINSLLKYGIFL